MILALFRPNDWQAMLVGIQTTSIRKILKIDNKPHANKEILLHYELGFRVASLQAQWLIPWLPR
jgi:hypothetical protein